MMSQVTNLVKFMIKLMFRLTVQLVVEFLKMGILSLVLLGSLIVLLVTFILGLRWAFTAFNGSVLAVVGFGACLIVLGFVSLLLLQYLVKDVFQLTDMTLWGLVTLVINAKKKDSERSKSKAQNEEPINGRQEQKLD